MRIEASRALAELDLTDRIVQADRALFSRWAGRDGRARSEAYAANGPPKHDPTGSILRIGYFVATAGFVVQTALHVAGLTLFDSQPVLLRSDKDDGLFSWVSSSIALTAAFGCLLVATVTTRRGHFLVLAALLAILSMDDALAFHERVGDDYFGLDPDLQAGRFVWPMLFFPVLAATAGLLWAVAREAPFRVAAVIRFGLVLLVVAVAMEAASAMLFIFDWGVRSKPYETEVALEEGLELVGMTLIASGLVALAYTGLTRFGERALTPE
jgi:hypothetical protein